MKKKYDGLKAYVINLNKIEMGYTKSTCVDAVQITYNGGGCEDCDWQGQVETYAEHSI